MQRRKLVRLTIIALLVIMSIFIAYKVFVMGYTFADLIPQNSYSVELVMNFSGIGEDVVVRTFLPESNQRQMITDALASGPNLRFHKETTPRFTRGEWSQYQATGPFQILYTYSAQVSPVRYNLPENHRIPDRYPPGLDQYLQATDVIQVEHPLIEELTGRILDTECCATSTLTNIYDYVLSLGSKPFKGTTDAITAAKLGEASCNGKSRLFIALARKTGIPARLVGGVILNSGSKRTSHQWVEAYIAGHWVPFDALNGHFAALPGNYLALYRGDEALFVHSRNIGFDYRFNINKRIVTNDRMAGFLGGHGLNLYKFLQSFKRVNISLNLLKFLLVIPLGVLVVVVSRNIVGIHTFGTFLPALMAIAIRETGLAAGVFAFLFVLALTLLFRYPLDKLGILHTPKLAIMMVIVVNALLFLNVISDLLKVDTLSAVGAAALFPVAILTITAERFAITLAEEGVGHTLRVMVQTIVVMAVCYFMMSSLALQALMLAFPELLLGVIALNLWIGSWTGLRITEMLRFRALYEREAEGSVHAG